MPKKSDEGLRSVVERVLRKNPIRGKSLKKYEQPEIVLRRLRVQDVIYTSPETGETDETDENEEWKGPFIKN